MFQPLIRLVLSWLDAGAEWYLPRQRPVILFVIPGTLLFLLIFYAFSGAGLVVLGLGFLVLLLEAALAAGIYLIQQHYEERVRARLDVADAVDGFLTNTDVFEEWKSFLATPQEAPELEAVRQRCRALPDEFPPQKPADYCGDEGIAALEAIVAELRSGFATLFFRDFTRWWSGRRATRSQRRAERAERKAAEREEAERAAAQMQEAQRQEAERKAAEQQEAERKAAEAAAAASRSSPPQAAASPPAESEAPPEPPAQPAPIKPLSMMTSEPQAPAPTPAPKAPAPQQSAEKPKGRRARRQEKKAARRAEKAAAKKSAEAAQSAAAPAPQAAAGDTGGLTEAAAIQQALKAGYTAHHYDQVQHTLERRQCVRPTPFQVLDALLKQPREPDRTSGKKDRKAKKSRKQRRADRPARAPRVRHRRRPRIRWKRAAVVFGLLGGAPFVAWRIPDPRRAPAVIVGEIKHQLIDEAPDVRHQLRTPFERMFGNRAITIAEGPRLYVSESDFRRCWPEPWGIMYEKGYAVLVTAEARPLLLGGYAVAEVNDVQTLDRPVATVD